MNIVIPMTGEGRRFINAGYPDIKPLIPVHGRPMISYVIDLFPGETNFTFICRESHLQTTPLRDTLLSLMPSAKIIVQEGKKLGPVIPLLEAQDAFDSDAPVIVSYCDYFLDWDYADFKTTIQQSGCDGDVPSYTGYHPHLRHEKNVYAGCRIDAQNTLLEIQEKHSFQRPKTLGHHSAGLYYFKHAKYISTYGQKMVDADHKVSGEFFVSMIYHYMLQDKLNISVYDKIPYFCQWGTPEDFEEYLYWAQIFKEFK
jgi:NDP-sugar pyrophosphorylase family protein